jgi:hypothetical protein
MTGVVASEHWRCFHARRRAHKEAWEAQRAGKLGAASRVRHVLSASPLITGVPAIGRPELGLVALPASRRRCQNAEAQRRGRLRTKAGLALYWLALPTASIEALLESEDLLPRYPQVGREHVHGPHEVEEALARYILRKCQR